MIKILIVEDDMLLNKTLSYNLIADGYDVTSSHSIATAKKELANGNFTLAVLDVNLPDGNGFDLCKAIKTVYHIPVIFLTANDLESDMIKGFELGADDYVTKPFPMSVFQKKIAALLNRLERKVKKDIYDDGYLMINFGEHSAMLGGAPITFTPMEYRTLKILIANCKNVLTRQTLLEKLWDIDANFVDEHTLTSVISRIRGKIEKNEMKYIKTVYGMGYIWAGVSNE